ncbi:MAG TPA: type II secretion system F family protein [Gemmatimonadaceae bacterium]|nr:type II secretion system F family protein [Gemmatimonadaceae bacterium]
MQTLLLLAVFFGTALLILGAYVFINRRRLEAVSVLKSRTTLTADVTILRDIRKSAVPVLDRILTGQTVTPLFERNLQRAGVKWSVGEYVLSSTLCGAVALVALQGLGPFVAFIAGGLGLMFPTFILQRLASRRLHKFEQQLPDAIDMIVNAMRAGFSFQAAMKFVGEEIPAPLGEEFMRFYDEQRLGVDVRNALLDLQGRIGSLDIKMFVTALLIQRETGGNLSEILTGLAAIIRDRSVLREQIATLTAEPRFTGSVLSVLPVIAFFALLWMNRPMMVPLMETDSGRFLLIYAASSVMLGYVIMRKIANIKV